MRSTGSLGVVVRLGDRVVVEHPTFPPLLDLLERLGAEVIGVDLDDEGMSLDGLRAALSSAASARSCSSLGPTTRAGCR